MSDHTVGSGVLRMARGTGQFYRTIWVMTGSAIVLSAAIIFYSQSNLLVQEETGIGNTFLLASKTFLPYMLAAVVSAITAMAVLALLPLRKLDEPTSRIVSRLELMASGDLATRLHINAEHPHLRDLAGAINTATGELARQVAHLKIVNRQQWELFCAVRNAAAAGDCPEVLRQAEIMERNWIRVAEIEQQLITG